jgi:hypothetical protein
MRLYLDDDSAATLLARLLTQAGHDVQTPADAGLSGEDDAVHLTDAIKDDRVLLTGITGGRSCLNGRRVRRMAAIQGWAESSQLTCGTEVGCEDSTSPGAPPSWRSPTLPRRPKPARQQFLGDLRRFS